MIATTYLQSVIRRFGDYKTLGDKTFEQLTRAQMLWVPAPETNSIALIIQHMHGNMLSRWTHFLTEDGEKPWRRRDAEFEVQDLSKEALLQLWEEGWQLLFSTLKDLKEEDLLQTVTIRTQPLTVIDAINRQLAHYSYHVGQVVFIGKMLKGAAWQNLSIPKGASATYNNSLDRSRH